MASPAMKPGEPSDGSKSEKMNAVPVEVAGNVAVVVRSFVRPAAGACAGQWAAWRVLIEAEGLVVRRLLLLETYEHTLKSKKLRVATAQAMVVLEAQQSVVIRHAASGVQLHMGQGAVDSELSSLSNFLVRFA